MSDKKKTGNVVALVNPEEMARVAFSNHVQSVAFQMSLSKGMIAELQVIRDWGYPRLFPKSGEPGGGQQYDEDWMKKHDRYKGMFPRVMSHFMVYRPPLERRGLAYSNPNCPFGDPQWVLTRAGGLMCELLVEAGLMPAAKSRKKRA
jgi:hypothetical protein